MITVLIVSNDRGSFSEFIAALQQHDGIEVTSVSSGSEAFSLIDEKSFGLVIADETLADMKGLEFLRRVVKHNPMLNCAAVSRLSPEGFHEATEGLGLLMQLPSAPKKEDAERLLEHWQKISGIRIRSTH